MRLRVSPKLTPRGRKIIRQVALELPELRGRTIWVSFQPKLTSYRGKLLSGSSHRGAPVHAAAFIRRRRIVLESSLLRTPTALRLILVHELFHFVWLRLNNADRQGFAALLKLELEARARGELGESAGVKKAELLAQGHRETPIRLWRDYVCESFCDTAAWLYGSANARSEFTLAISWRVNRRRWFVNKFARPRNF